MVDTLDQQPRPTTRLRRCIASACPEARRVRLRKVLRECRTRRPASLGTFEFMTDESHGAVATVTVPIAFQRLDNINIYICIYICVYI